MMFSIIMQSRISDENRIEKLYRAINSVLCQKTTASYELIIVCDDCQKSFDIISESYAEEFKSARPRLRLFMSKTEHKEKNKIYSIGRNVGLSYAGGTWVLYLDNDDYLTNNYLKELSKQVHEAQDWFIVDDLIYDKIQWKQRCCNLIMGQCGTSNIIHKSSMLSRWANISSYGRDDWRFINNLKLESKKFRQLNIAGYCVARIPNRYDV